MRAVAAPSFRRSAFYVFAAFNAASTRSLRNGGSAQPNARCIVNRVGDRGDQRLVAALAGAIGRQIGAIRIGIAVDQHDVDRLGRVRMPQAGMRNPVDTGDFLGVELHFFPERTTQGMQHAALDGVAQTLRD